MLLADPRHPRQISSLINIIKNLTLNLNHEITWLCTHKKMFSRLFFYNIPLAFPGSYFLCLASNFISNWFLCFESKTTSTFNGIFLQDYRWSCGRECDMGTFTSPENDPEELREMWSDLQTCGDPCGCS